MNETTINQEKEWDSVINSLATSAADPPAGGGSFLQGLAWADFQNSLGHKTWSVNIENKLLGLIVKYSLPLNKSYLYCPRGPIFKNADLIENFLEQVKEIAQAEKAIFLKIEPTIEIDFKKYGFKKTDKTVQPKQTLVLDISKTEEQLLKSMHQKTRYNIKLAQKRGVQVGLVDQPAQKDIDVFWNLSKQTSARDKFSLYPKQYYEKLLKQSGLVKLAVAKFENKIVASNIICFFGQFAIYLHGASDYSARQLMAPYLLQWQSILAGKKEGYKYYDFWGIDQSKWPGITRFKKGFGGEEINYIGAGDLSWRKNWHKMYKLAKTILK